MSVDLDRKIHGDPILLQKQHGLPKISLFLDLSADVHSHPFTDALDLGKTLRLLLHDAERICLEFFNNPFS